MKIIKLLFRIILYPLNLFVDISILFFEKVTLFFDWIYED